jgi:hypothetical protein
VASRYGPSTVDLQMDRDRRSSGSSTQTAGTPAANPSVASAYPPVRSRQPARPTSRPAARRLRTPGIPRRIVFGPRAFASRTGRARMAKLVRALDRHRRGVHRLTRHAGRGAVHELRAQDRHAESSARQVSLAAGPRFHLAEERICLHFLRHCHEASRTDGGREGAPTIITEPGSGSTCRWRLPSEGVTGWPPAVEDGRDRHVSDRPKASDPVVAPRQHLVIRWHELGRLGGRPGLPPGRQTVTAIDPHRPTLTHEQAPQRP